jgi:hypothetical protein
LWANGPRFKSSQCATNNSGDPIAQYYKAANRWVLTQPVFTKPFVHRRLALEGEASIIEGTGSQTNASNWGDYSSMSIDPVDDCTFWYTTECLKENSNYNWSTRIASFKFPQCR